MVIDVNFRREVRKCVDYALRWLDGTPAHFIGLDDLIRNKQVTGRARDLGDIEELRKRKRESGQIRS